VKRVRVAIVTGLVILGSAGLGELGYAPLEAPLQADATRAALRPTNHPPVPRGLDALWLVPASAAAPSPAVKSFAKGVELIGQESFAEARPLVTPESLDRTPIADYARYYRALIHLRTGAPDKAFEGFQRLNASNLAGVLGEWAMLGEASAAEQSGKPAEAAATFAALSRRKPEQPDLVLAGQARTLYASGQRDAAIAAYRDLYLNFPLSPVATEAWRELQKLAAEAGVPAMADPSRELARAEKLFSSKRYAEALDAFEALNGRVQGGDRELAALRAAESQFYLGRHRQAVNGTQPFVDRGARQAEARFFYLSALRGTGDHTAYVAEARRLVADHPDQSWAEETLNNLATHYILVDDDQTASTVFAEYLDRFPRGRHAARASWKLGWWRYRSGDFESASTIFDRAAADFPRSDYRSSWLYWSAKAYDRLKQPDTALARYALVSTDYLHSYYGRLAEDQLVERKVSPADRQKLAWRDANAAIGSGAPAGDAAGAAPAGPPPNAAQIRHLVAAGLHETARAEVQYARRQWGSTPQLDATLAWILREQGEYRPAINAMKRAYPQYLSDQGHLLPVEARKVLFPLDYWPLIRRHAGQRGLDPYLIAALVAQESTFDADVRSSANAYGLMQIVPSTGRRLARTLGIRRFSTSKLTDPDINVRMGTLYYKNLVNQFGGDHYALASYNAGESRVVRWIAERGELPRDEFIDDIPFPETQNYVKKILGTAEDYRLLYPASTASRAAGN
jgi:soluble lytic murein transglycosylase